MKGIYLQVVLGVAVGSLVGCENNSPPPPTAEQAAPETAESPTPEVSPPLLAEQPVESDTQPAPTPEASPPSPVERQVAQETEKPPIPKASELRPQPPSVPEKSPPAPAIQLPQAENQSIKDLPDGTYFYGESPVTDSPGRKYLVFQKNGNSVTGQEYFWQTDNSHCFNGIVRDHAINNVEIAYLEPALEGAKWSFAQMDAIETRGLYQLGFEKAPEFAINNLQECLKLFANEVG